MTLHSIGDQARRRIRDAWSQGIELAGGIIRRRPVAAAAVIAAAGMFAGLGLGAAEISRLQSQVASHDSAVEDTRRQAQREVNALAARVAELQAEANRLNALGERLTQLGDLVDGEFDFKEPIALGGVGPVQDMPVGGLVEDMDAVQGQLAASGGQLSVLEALLFDRELERSAVPSRSPVASSYITSGYGTRADPFRGGRAFHRGIDFHARHGDPVMAVADGVVSYSGWRSGYGNVVEVDHGNGYVTRYAHNTRNTVRVGDLVRSGQEVAKAGSTGRSTGTHVHFEVWENGRVLNPRQFLADAGRAS
ncbi:MAG: peptidoglycan DD-metalloendopeptidase family protein [Gammaproteobacteria bacterium]|nr:peptidoglycan DD-metalloendopeptidase family protein [Gammaproteobacteria bacterium]